MMCGCFSSYYILLLSSNQKHWKTSRHRFLKVQKLNVNYLLWKRKWWLSQGHSPCQDLKKDRSISKWYQCTCKYMANWQLLIRNIWLHNHGLDVFLLWEIFVSHILSRYYFKCFTSYYCYRKVFRKWGVCQQRGGHSTLKTPCVCLGTDKRASLQYKLWCSAKQ